MSTFIQLILEVTDGDDLAFARVTRGDDILIVVEPEFENTHILGDKVKAQLHSFAYIPAEALE